MRKLLYIIYIPLLIIEWCVDMLGNMWKAFHESIISITLKTETIINEPDIQKPDN